MSMLITASMYRWHWSRFRKDKEVHQMRVEYKKSAVYGDMIYPRIAAEDDRTVVELCDENAKPYAVIEFRFA